MPRSNIKNLKIMPTSKLIFYSLNSNQSEFSEDEINKHLAHRLLRNYKLDKQTARKLLERDFDLIEKRSSNIEDYVFDCNRGVKITKEMLYKNLKIIPIDGEKLEEERDLRSLISAEDLTYSELCLGYTIMNRFGFFYESHNYRLKNNRKISSNQSFYEYYQYYQEEVEKILEFYKVTTNFFVKNIGDLMVEVTENDNTFSILKKSVSTAINELKEASKCISIKDEMEISETLNTYRKRSLDILPLDKQIILDNEQALKIYKLVNKK